MDQIRMLKRFLTDCQKESGFAPETGENGLDAENDEKPMEIGEDGSEAENNEESMEIREDGSDAENDEEPIEIGEDGSDAENDEEPMNAFVSTNSSDAENDEEPMSADSLKNILRTPIMDIIFGDFNINYFDEFVKRNRGNTMDYVSMTLQTSPNTSCEALLYSPQNRTLFAESQTRRTPFKLRDFTCTDDQKMVANDMTFVGVPHQSEYSSQQAEVPSQFSKESVKVLEVLNTIKEWDSVVVRGKITQINETTNVGSKGLKLSQAVITDATASIQLENSARCMLDNRQVSAMWHDAC
ncbi:hypothetical protein AWC38_SpisGene21907 [Stylophora pistillata]|uniref:Uncharacterized protein n=1 Tax=Stylophora pistillata TaxID=50429 RepID=A0A2B4RCF6_STYPI|nr:hypothetical protein AWC38_SpisGene21907 [Stylophora pistillata]